MKLKFGGQSNALEGGEDDVFQKPGALFQQAIAFLQRIATDLPETIREELICTKRFEKTVNILGKMHLLSHEQEDKPETWVEVRAGPGSLRPDEMVILKTEGPLKKVVGQYVGPEIVDGKQVLVLTDMSPEQTRELVDGLYNYALGTTKPDHDGVRIQQPIDTGFVTESANEADRRDGLSVKDEVLAEAERILEEAWESDRQDRANGGDYRQVPNLDDFFKEPQVTMHADFSQLISP